MKEQGTRATSIFEERPRDSPLRVVRQGSDQGLVQPVPAVEGAECGRNVVGLEPTAHGCVALRRHVRIVRASHEGQGHGLERGGVDRQVEIVGKGAAPEDEAIDGRAAQQGPSACGGGTL